MILAEERKMVEQRSDAGDPPHSLAQSACAIHSLNPLSEVLQAITDEARCLIGAHQARTRMVLGEQAARVVQAVAFSDKYAAWKTQHVNPTADEKLDQVVCRSNRALRLSHPNLVAHPAWEPWNHAVSKQPPVRGWLAVPLSSEAGRNFGLIQLTDKCGGEFDARDEALLTDFARMASTALQNAWQHHAVQVANEALLERLRGAMLQSEISDTLLNGADLREALQSCVERMARHLRVACAQVWVKQDDNLSLVAHLGPTFPTDLATCPINVGSSILGKVAAARQSRLANVLDGVQALRERDWVAREGLAAFAACPLLLDEQLEGVLAIFDHRPFVSTVLDPLVSASRTIAPWLRRQRLHEAVMQGADATAADSKGAARCSHAIVVHSLDGVISDWNAGAAELFGYPSSEAVGKHFSLVVPEDARPEHDDSLRRIGRGEEVAVVRSFLLHKSGRRLAVGLTRAPLRDRDGQLVGAVTAIHDRSEMQMLEAHCERAERIEALNQLASGVVHDFNNILTVVLGFSEVLSSRVDPGDGGPNLAAEIHKAGKRAESLVRHLQLLTTKKHAELQRIDLSALLTDTEKLLRRVLGEHILITTIIEPHLQRIQADPLQMQQVILNLAVHARDAMPAGGRLTLETANMSRPVGAPPAPSLVPHPMGGRNGSTSGALKPACSHIMLAVSIADRGMSEAVRGRMIQPLFETKGFDQRTGPGLMTALRIARAAGGEVEWESEPGNETTLKLIFPCAGALTDVPVASPMSTAGSMPNGTETILLVEDEEAVRMLARRVLEMCGYTVLEAQNGQEALWLGVNHTGPIDLLVSDVVLPELGGGELAKRLLLINPQIKVLFLSGYPFDIVAEQGVLRPDFGFLQKPFATSALTQKVRSVLDSY